MHGGRRWRIAAAACGSGLHARLSAQADSQLCLLRPPYDAVERAGGAGARWPRDDALPDVLAMHVSVWVALSLIAAALAAVPFSAVQSEAEGRETAY